MNSSKEHFLVTTALEEFWAVDKPIIFLGEWCRLYSRRSFWAPLKGTLLPSQWNDERKISEAFEYVDEFYERMLVALANRLNAVHGVNHSHRYWRILIGPWLFHYIHVLYDRYCSLKSALEAYPGFTTIGLAEESFMIPQDAQEFNDLIADDLYNLQFYTKIMLLLGQHFPRKVYATAKVAERRNGRALKYYLKQIVKKLFSRMSADHKSLFILNPYFPGQFEQRLFGDNKAKIRIVNREDIACADLPINSEMRERLRIVGTGLNEFERIFVQLIPFDLPKIYLEGYAALQAEVKINPAILPKAIFSANAWYFNERFQQLAAAAADKGVCLIGAQHGGIYGIHRYMAVEKHELAITDKYYSWGWYRTGCAANVVPFYANKLTGVRAMVANNKMVGILLVTTSLSRYLLRFQYFNSYRFTSYLKDQLQFAGFLSPEMRRNTSVRLYASDYGWGSEQRWRDAFPEITVETMAAPFLKRIENCRLVVIDNFFTTFMEVLALNKPVISFGKTYQLRPDAQPLFDELRSVGILYDSPETAAQAVKAIYPDVETWWNDPPRQAARRKFCERFARVSADSAAAWQSEFKELINQQ